MEYELTAVGCRLAFEGVKFPGKRSIQLAHLDNRWKPAICDTDVLSFLGAVHLADPDRAAALKESFLLGEACTPAFVWPARKAPVRPVAVVSAPRAATTKVAPPKPVTTDSSTGKRRRNSFYWTPPEAEPAPKAR